MSACPNCGSKNFQLEKIGFECRNCGMKNIESKELSPCELIFCDDCGNHYLSPPGCPTHSEDKQHPAKW
jgi:hypothetical protein